MREKKIHLYFIHKTVKGLNEAVKYLKLDESKFEYVWDEENPDYLFVSEHIYLKKKIYKQFLQMAEKNPIIIYVAGECIAPDMNLFDYAIVFNRNLKMGDRIARMPAMYFHSASVLKNTNEIATVEQAREEYQKKMGFCNFLYSNSKAHPMRDKLFFALSEYKKVDSLGGHLRNVTQEEGKLGTYDWSAGGIGIKKNYRFSIASENAVYEGYVTEKLLTSFQAHTVPVYFGDPGVKEEFNSEAFIYVNECENLEDVIRKVKAVEENEDAWVHMIMQPWQTDEQVSNTEKQFSEYRNFLSRIFDSDKEAAKRRPEGTYPDEYRKWYKQGFYMDLNEIIYRIGRKLQKHS